MHVFNDSFFASSAFIFGGNCKLSTSETVGLLSTKNAMVRKAVVQIPAETKNANSGCTAAFTAVPPTAKPMGTPKVNAAEISPVLKVRPLLVDISDT